MNKGNIPERSARRYVSLFSEGQSSNRKSYAPREKPKYTSKAVKKIMKKAKERTKILSLREIEVSCDISHEVARQILHDNDFSYSSHQKKRELTEEDYKIRLAFTQNMLKK